MKLLASQNLLVLLLFLLMIFLGTEGDSEFLCSRIAFDAVIDDDDDPGVMQTFGDCLVLELELAQLAGVLGSVALATTAAAAAAAAAASALLFVVERGSSFAQAVVVCMASMSHTIKRP